MREFAIPVNLEKGLRPYPLVKPNSEYLTEALNVKATETGLEPYDPISIPFSYEQLVGAGVQLEWPFPQLLHGKGKTLLATGRNVFLVNIADMSLHLIDDMYDPVSGSLATAVKGNQWQFVDFWDTWALHNGVSTIFHTGLNTYFGSATPDRVYVSSSVRVQAGCAFRGRSWMGGFDPSYFYSSAWETFIEGMKTMSTAAQSQLSGLEENWILASSIGGGDVFELFYGTTYPTSSLDSSSGYSASPTVSSPFGEFWMEKIRENTWFSAPMPWQGRVRAMKALGDMVMVFGDGGVTGLQPQGEFVRIVEFSDLKNGIHGHAVGGSEIEQLLLDQEGVLWYLEAGKRPVELGYREHMIGLVGSDVTISYTPLRRGEFYICNGYKSFVLTKAGLTEHKQIVTSIAHINGQALCMGTFPDSVSSTMRLVTDRLDMNERGRKTTTWVDLTAYRPYQEFYDDETQINVGFDYRYANNEKFSRSALIPTNLQGQARVAVAGQDLRLVVESNEFRNTVVKEALIRYNVDDRRYVRGVQVNV